VTDGPASDPTYVFGDTRHDAELARLRALELAFDPLTRRWLLATGLGAGWRCLEVGAGAGSIAGFLAERAGAAGRVVAVDVSARFLAGRAGPNLEIVEADVRTAPLEREAFDLVHARFLLIHLADWASALAAMTRCLRPGGWLVLEEPDFSAARFVDGGPGPGQAFERVHRAIAAMFEQRGMDPAFGRRLRRLLEERGLEQISAEDDAPVDRGGGPIARMMGMSAGQLADKYVATGLASGADIDLYGRLAQDPTSAAVYHGTARAAGRKPIATIRTAVAGDLPAIAALAARVWRAHYPGIISPAQIEYMLARMYDLRVLEREVREDGIRYERVEEGGALVGFASWGRREQEEDGGGEETTAKLHKIYVDPDRQRRGLGRRLLAHVEGRAREAGFRKLVLKVNKRNAGAIAAYQRCGFAVAAGAVTDIGGGFVMDDWIMEKGL
jgi:ribosomal protein S18 acetylase RimI-like enzyme